MSTEPKNRREFLRAAVRAVLLGSVALLGGVLFRRQHECPSRGECDGCPASDSCSLPWKEARR